MDRKYSIHPPAGSREIDFSSELNAEQLAAVTCGPGASLVIAGAGSGKTRTLTYRVAWLLSRGVAPSSILLLTFTNKAAREMIERVAQLDPSAAGGIWGGTFHSIGNRILRRHADVLGYQAGFSILDREDSEDLIDSVVARAGLRDKGINFPKAGVLADLFSLSANTGHSVRKLVEQKYRYFHRLIPDLEAMQLAYDQKKQETNSLDFDDLLAKTLAIFALNTDVLADYQRRFQHVLVDEYQDTNLLQARMVDLLGAGHGNVMVVGDDAQSIYSWRGADCANILEFPQRYPGAKVFTIETNYRSVPGVLALANAAIAGNPAQFAKNLTAVRPAAETPPALVALATNNQQAAFVAQRVLELSSEGIAFEDMAVLYRAHYHSMEIQLEFTRRGIPYSVTSGLRFFEQAHIKDVAAYMKFSVNPRDEVAFKRIVRLLPGIGSKTAESVWRKLSEILGGESRFDRLHEGVKLPAKAAAAWKQLVHTLEEIAPGGEPLPPAEMIHAILLAGYEEYLQGKYTNFDSRREDLGTLENYARAFPDAEEFLAQLALLSSVETAEATAEGEDPDRVTLSSIHQAKGLEWKVVFLVWLTEGMFPGSRSLDNPVALEEERRLFYVGVTRCKDELYLTYPEMRLNAAYGEALQRPSRFVSELPNEVMEVREVQPDYSALGGHWQMKAQAQATAREIEEEPF